MIISVLPDPPINKMHAPKNVIILLTVILLIVTINKRVKELISPILHNLVESLQLNIVIQKLDGQIMIKEAKSKDHIAED